MTSHDMNAKAVVPGLRPVAIRLIALTLVAGLAGCAGHMDGGRMVSFQEPMSVEERHPIVVDKAPKTLDVAVGRSQYGLTDFQKVEVEDFIGNWRQEGTGRLMISAPSGSSNERSAYQVVAEIRQILKGFGVPQSAVAVDSYYAGGGKPPVKMSFVRYVATGPDCGHFSENLAEDPRNVHYENFGCAGQHNLALMIANPRDLVEPRGTTDRSGERRDFAWQQYIKGKSTISETKDAEKAGTISDVAKQ
ncbi:MAG: CpaD family pilus assembly protein [Hyphomicrobiaceae bacterium]